MPPLVSSIVEDLDPDLVRRFALAGPRYTSYPTADRFVESFGPADHKRALAGRNADAPLSLYVHIPFCESLCYYCACNKIVTHDRRRGSRYVDYLAKEIALQIPHRGGDRRLSQLHFGGGTPTFLTDDDLDRLMAMLRRAFEFAPDGELAIALRTGRLQRNFQGYSTHPDCDLLALGTSGISKLGTTYSQNVRAIQAYEALLDDRELPVARGIVLTPDDIVRRAIIMGLMCQGMISMKAIEATHQLDFRSTFAAELSALVPFERVGLVECDGDAIQVTPKGRLLVRPLSMVFDKYIQSARARAAYSKVA